MKLFNKEVNDYIDIAIEHETYIKLKTVSTVENKTFSEIIEEGLKGKKLVL